MPRYHTLGKIPHKRHTVFKKGDGNIHFEQLFEPLDLMVCHRYYIIFTSYPSFRTKRAH